MKIIINENKLELGLKKLINKVGFSTASKMTNLSSYELAKKSNYDISRDYYIYFNVAIDILLEIIKKNKKIPSNIPMIIDNNVGYELGYDNMSGVIEWYLHFIDENGYEYKYIGYATPFYSNKTDIPIDAVSLEVNDTNDNTTIHNDDYFGNYYQKLSVSPFDNVEDLKDYLLTTYIKEVRDNLDKSFMDIIEREGF
jgi:hypothetical protein